MPDNTAQNTPTANLVYHKCRRFAVLFSRSRNTKPRFLLLKIYYIVPFQILVGENTQIKQTMFANLPLHTLVLITLAFLNVLQVFGVNDFLKIIVVCLFLVFFFIKITCTSRTLDK